MGFERGLLHEVGLVDPGLDCPADQRPLQQAQGVAILLQKPAARGNVAGAGLLQEDLRPYLPLFHGPLQKRSYGLWEGRGFTKPGIVA
jgi:hypothetical protein